MVSTQGALWIGSSCLLLCADPFLTSLSSDRSLTKKLRWMITCWSCPVSQSIAGPSLAGQPGRECFYWHWPAGAAIFWRVHFCHRRPIERHPCSVVVAVLIRLADTVWRWRPSHYTSGWLGPRSWSKCPGRTLMHAWHWPAAGDSLQCCTPLFPLHCSNMICITVGVCAGLWPGSVGLLVTSEPASHKRWGACRIPHHLRLWCLPQYNMGCLHWLIKVHSASLPTPSKYAYRKVGKVVVWNMFYFPIYWECHNPIWQNHLFQRGRLKPPTRILTRILTVINQY